MMRPFSVFRMMSLHNLQKLLGAVMGVPSVSVIMDATPVASEKFILKALDLIKSKQVFKRYVFDIIHSEILRHAFFLQKLYPRANTLCGNFRIASWIQVRKDKIRSKLGPEPD